MFGTLSRLLGIERGLKWLSNQPGGQTPRHQAAIYYQSKGLVRVLDEKARTTLVVRVDHETAWGSLIEMIHFNVKPAKDSLIWDVGKLYSDNKPTGQGNVGITFIMFTSDSTPAEVMEHAKAQDLGRVINPWELLATALLNPDWVKELSLSQPAPVCAGNDSLLLALHSLEIFQTNKQKFRLGIWWNGRVKTIQTFHCNDLIMQRGIVGFVKE